MKLFRNKKSRLLPLVGFCSGLLNGLLGAGGGIAIVYGLKYVRNEEDLDPRDVFANALCAMLPISVVSCILYAARGDLTVEGFGPYVLPALLGGVLGGLLLGKIHTKHLQKLFATLVVISGLLLLIR